MYIYMYIYIYTYIHIYIYTYIYGYIDIDRDVYIGVNRVNPEGFGIRFDFNMLTLLSFILLSRTTVPRGPR